MLARLGPTYILHRLGHHILTTSPTTPRSPSSTLWFLQVRAVGQHYCLPNPLTILDSLPSKGEWKGMVRRQVVAYWGGELRRQDAVLPSLTYLRASHMALATPSQLWTSCKGSQLEVRKATIQTRMLSGRYRTSHIM